jgi:general secretion pathway protein E
MRQRNDTLRNKLKERSVLESADFDRGLKVNEVAGDLSYENEASFMKGLAKKLNLEFLDEIPYDASINEILFKVPINYAKKYNLIPFKATEDSIHVAVSDPFDNAPIDDLRMLFDRHISIFLATSSTIIDSINSFYDKTAHTAEEMMENLEEEENLTSIASELEEPEDLLDVSDEAPIIRLVNTILFQSVKNRASDIHIEPFGKTVVVRYRVDGVLYNILTTSKRYQSAIASRIKIMAGLDIAEKRLPQDGRIRIKIAGRDIDIRVSVVPTSHGERIVLRLLDKGSVLLSLEDIGMDKPLLEETKKVIEKTNGIILVTGPTGSGKTTTLYAAMTRLNSTDKNIITVEDPVEYQLHGIGQIQVNTKIDLTFANGLRSILRQDPDIIMVGEIRDKDTAEIAIQASLTGHLVFSTLHTNDSATAVTRLIDMDIEPFLVSSSLLAVYAQRLVRVICQECKEPYTPKDEELKELNIPREKLKDGLLYKGVGCSKCMNTGYKGRTAIYELLMLNDTVKSLILKTQDSNAIKKEAIRLGMKTIRENGSEKVIKGITTVEEVVRVTQEEV